MAPPVIAASTRYMDLGVTKVYYIPTIAASTLIPTRTEMNAGKDLSPELGDWSGWMLAAEFLDTQPINSGFKSTIPGSLSAGTCTLTFYASKTGVDVRAVLPPGTTGAIMFCDGGDTTGNKGEVWPIWVATNSVLRNSPGVSQIAGGSSASSGGSSDTGALIVVGFAITAAPAQLVTIP